MILTFTLSFVCVCLAIAIIADIKNIRQILQNGVTVKAKFKGYDLSQATSRPFFYITFPDGSQQEKSTNYDSGYFKENKGKEFIGIYDQTKDILIIKDSRFTYGSTLVISVFFLLSLSLLMGVITAVQLRAD